MRWSPSAFPNREQEVVGSRIRQSREVLNALVPCIPCKPPNAESTPHMFGYESRWTEPLVIRFVQQRSGRFRDSAHIRGNLLSGKVGDGLCGIDSYALNAESIGKAVTLFSSKTPHLRRAAPNL